MWAAIGRRVLAAVPTLIGVTLVTFLVMEVAPGDPASLAAAAKAPGVDREQVRPGSATSWAWSGRRRNGT